MTNRTEWRPRGTVLRLLRREARIVIAFLLIAIVLFGVARVSSELAEGESFAFDRWILLALREPGDLSRPIGSPWVRAAFLDLTALGGTTVLTLFTIIAAGYLLAARKRLNALLLVASIGLGAIVCTLLKHLFARPRPDLVAHLVDVSSASFPSGHAMNSAVTYLTLGVLLARLEPDRCKTAYLLGAAILLTLLVGASRVYLGVHWPTDVLAGWAVGGCWALLCWAIGMKLDARHQVEPPDRAP